MECGKNRSKCDKNSANVIKIAQMRGGFDGAEFFFFFWFAHSFHRCYGKGSRGARAIMCCAWVDIMTAGASDRTHCPENERVVTTNISEQKGGGRHVLNVRKDKRRSTAKAEIAITHRWTPVLTRHERIAPPPRAAASTPVK